MRQLVPDVVDVADLAAHEARLARPAHAERPWVLCNMIASADGAVEVGGVSGPLGGPADKAMFRALRSVADVILVGAGTVRHERYGPPRITDDVVRDARLARGQQPAPRLAVVTAGGQLDPELPLFADAGNRPYVLTVAALPADRRAALAHRAEVVVAGDERVDLALALAHLHADGAAVVLAEGGPTLNGHLLAGDLVDEWRLTLSPVLAAGTAARAAVGPAAEPHHRFRLERVLMGDDLVLLRYLR